MSICLMIFHIMDVSPMMVFLMSVRLMEGSTTLTVCLTIYCKSNKYVDHFQFNSNLLLRIHLSAISIMTERLYKNPVSPFLTRRVREGKCQHSASLSLGKLTK